MAERVLVLSDRMYTDDDSTSMVVCDRDDAASLMTDHQFRAVCLDRDEIDAALSDLRWLRKRRTHVPVVAWVDANQVTDAVELLAAGAEEIIVRDAALADSLASRLDSIEKRQRHLVPIRRQQGLIARSRAMQLCLELVQKAQHSEATVLLEGETGTGKEVIARSIHQSGKRSAGEFVAINCAAFPETLLESELFGHERGAFTGANRSRPGLFVEANAGTLFLDEIGETSLGFQVKLLRVLQEGRLRPLGSEREVTVDARIIAATNRELSEAVEQGVFRQDLFYRLNVFPICLPPLRARTEDIVHLVTHFLSGYPEGTAPTKAASDAIRLLEAYRWPGNVRELENEVARIVASVTDEVEITARMLSPQIQGLDPALPRSTDTETLRHTMARFEAWVLRRALEAHGDRRIATARTLGITREALYKKLKRHGMQ